MWVCLPIHILENFQKERFSQANFILQVTGAPSVFIKTCLHCYFIFLYSESLPELLVPQSFGIKCSHRFVGAAVPMRLWEQLFPLICGHGSFINLWEQLFPQICRNSILFIILRKYQSEKVNRLWYRDHKSLDCICAPCRKKSNFYVLKIFECLY